MPQSAFRIEDPLFAEPAHAGSGFEALLSSISPAFPEFTAEPLCRQPFSWRSDLSSCGGVSLLRARYGADWTYTPQELTEHLAVRFCGAGVLLSEIAGEQIVSKRGTAIVTSAASVGRSSVHATEMPAASATFLFRAEEVHAHMHEAFEGAKLSALRLVSLVDLDTDAGQMLTALCRTIAQGLTGDQLLLKSPKAMALLTEAAIRLVLEQMPHRWSERIDSRSARILPRHVKRAIDFMHANMHLPIRLADIAEAAGVSVRTLQTGFQRFRGTSPLHYLRRIRLDAVHAELCAPENILSVQGIALKWGFTNMGRFAAQYKAVFGVYPSETLRKVL